MTTVWLHRISSDPELELTAFYRDRRDAIASVGHSFTNVDSYYDDKGLSFQWPPARVADSKVFVQKCFLPLLYECPWVEMQEAKDLLESTPFIVCYVGSTNQHLAKKWSEVGFRHLHFEGGDILGSIAKLSSLTNNVYGVLESLSVYEHLSRREYTTVPEGCIPKDEFGNFEVVTAGLQYGLTPRVDCYRRYWHRFFDWLERSGRSKQGRLAIDLVTVEELGSEVSMLGFLYALREIRNGEA